MISYNAFNKTATDDDNKFLFAKTPDRYTATKGVLVVTAYQKKNTTQKQVLSQSPSINVKN